MLSLLLDVCRKESIYDIVIYLGYIMDNYGYYVISCMTMAGTQWSCRRGPITEVIHNNKIINLNSMLLIYAHYAFY